MAQTLWDFARSDVFDSRDAEERIDELESMMGEDSNLTGVPKVDVEYFTKDSQGPPSVAYATR